MPACSICSGHSYKDKVCLFTIPTEEWRRQLWNKACNRTFTDTDRLCERHFVRADFIDIPGTRKINKRTAKARLLPCAVPSVFFEKYDSKAARLLLVHPYETQSKENLRKDRIKLDRLDRFGFFSARQRMNLVDSEDEREISQEDCQFDDNHTKKCGLISYNIDEVFTLKCFFCSTICLDLFTFSEHVKKQHNNLSKVKIENPTNAVADIKSVNATSSQSSLKIKAEQGVEMTTDNPVRALSNMVFADLKGVPEHIFLDNKWKILDVLKEAVRDHVKEKKKKKDKQQDNTNIPPLTITTSLKRKADRSIESAREYFEESSSMDIDNPVRALANMVFADLKGVSEYIFLDAKWQILDILRDAVRQHVKEKKTKDTLQQANNIRTIASKVIAKPPRSNKTKPTTISVSSSKDISSAHTNAIIKKKEFEILSVQVLDQTDTETGTDTVVYDDTNFDDFIVEEVQRDPPYDDDDGVEVNYTIHNFNDGQQKSSILLTSTMEELFDDKAINF